MHQTQHLRACSVCVMVSRESILRLAEPLQCKTRAYACDLKILAISVLKISKFPKYSITYRILISQRPSLIFHNERR